MGFGDGSGIGWTTCKQSAPRSRQITTPTPQAGCSSWCPTNSVKTLKARSHVNNITKSSCAKQRANCNTTAFCLIAKANFTEITPKAIELITALKFLVQLHYTTSMILKNCVAWWCNS